MKRFRWLIGVLVLALAGFGYFYLKPRIEAVVLSLAGGVLGVLLGVLGNQIIYRITGFFIPTALYSVLIGFGFAALVGVAFGYFPARKAAKLNPIDALRYE